MERQNKFRIIVASYNNEDWVEYNLASILNQTYTNYHVMYVDDCSTDKTSDLVQQIVGDSEKFTIIRNSTNLGADGAAIYNYLRFFDSLDDDEICVMACGDDWLFDENVLANLNNLYNKKDVWMSYGEFYVYDGTSKMVRATPQNTLYPDFIHQNKLYRRDVWRAGHLLTLRGFLAKAIDQSDIRSKIDNKLFYHAPDLAVTFPCLEMCPVEKIGVADFPTYVWNGSDKCQVRTFKRQTAENEKYEVEIRNKKHYRERIGNGKLPQVNVIGGYMETNNIPKEFSYVYNLADGEFDITLITDMEILKYIAGDIKINRGKVVADIHEAPHLLSQRDVYTAVKDNSHMFDLILTFDKELLKLPNAVFRNGGYEVVLNKNVHRREYPTLQDDSLVQIYTEKPKHISFITSNKTMTDGHVFRVNCAAAINNLPDSQVDLFGVGIREIPGKIVGLRDYKFSIAIENGIHDNYFTEKILDCFLTGTIPIYRGCENIGEFFNPKGFITFDTEQELLNIVSKLTDEDYYSRQEYIEENFEKAKQYSYNNDKLFNKYLKHLV